MMEVTCPKCGSVIDVSEVLPEFVCDSEDIECECGVTLSIGWTAEAEIRDYKDTAMEVVEGESY